MVTNSERRQCEEECLETLMLVSRFSFYQPRLPNGFALTRNKYILREIGRTLGRVVGILKLNGTIGVRYVVAILS